MTQLTETQLQENLAAARVAAIEVRRLVDAGAEPADARAVWLQRRWDELQQQHPMVSMPYRFTMDPKDPYRTTSIRESVVVDPRNIVDAGSQRWGTINNRPHIFDLVLSELDRAIDTDQLGEWHTRFAGRSLSLLATNGPFGPIYEVHEGGRHRSMMARALQLPYLVSDVTSRGLPGPDVEIQFPIGESGFTMKDLAYYEGLVHAGIATRAGISVEGSLWAVLPAATAEFDWRFDPPEQLRQTSQIYAAIYPRFAVEYPDAMGEPATDRGFARMMRAIRRGQFHLRRYIT
jgi:hypothetical protein